MDARNSSPLCKLPPELLLEIRGYLDASAFCSLRVTCTFLYACTLHHFGKTYLTTIQSDLSLSSLQRLEDLTRNPRLCPYVHSLDIKGGNSDILGIGLEWERPAVGLPLSRTQKSIQRLQDIIVRLEDCQSFHLHKRNWVPSTSPLNPFDGITIILGIVAAFLAYGILHMRSVGGWEGWRWLFVLEGTLTFFIGVVSWFYLPPGPTQTASWFRGKDGWFTEREEVIMVNRVLRDDPGKVSELSTFTSPATLTWRYREACITVKVLRSSSSGMHSWTMTSGHYT